MIVDAQLLRVPHVVQGRLQVEAETEYRSRDTGSGFVTPRLDLDAVAPRRAKPGPAFNLPLDEVLSFLDEVGRGLTLRNPYLRNALDSMRMVSTLSEATLEFCYARLGKYFRRDALEFEIEQDVSRAVLDGWTEVRGPDGSVNHVRAFPPRVAHILAGNSPDVAAMSIVRGALTKGVHLLKMASNDLFTATAILRVMADIDPEHPVLRSFSAVYWKGGDERIESALYRAQYFDKLVAWGGEKSVRHALKYVGPGFELITFDPKTSISLIGREAFENSATLANVAEQGAADAAMFEQDACASSRYQFVEGGMQEVDRYCALLVERLGAARPLNSAQGRPPPRELREQVDGLRDLEPSFRVWGAYDGRGLVIRSDEPVDFHPDARTVNVVMVKSLLDAAQFCNVSTQTIGVYPCSRKAEVRDAIMGAGGQRIVPLGRAGAGLQGLPHDGKYSLHQLMRWVVDCGSSPAANAQG